MNLAFDLDGVITSHIKAAQIQALTKFGIPITPEMITEFGLSECTSLSGEQERDIWKDKNTYKLMPIIDNAQSYLQSMSKKHTIYILTARYTDLWPVTSAYLRDNDVPWDYIEMSLVDKGYWFEKHKLTHPIALFVDDKAEHVRDAIPYVKKAVLFDSGLPYTAGIKIPRNTYRVKSWGGIMALVKELENELQ